MTQPPTPPEFHNPQNIPTEKLPPGARFCLKSEVENPPDENQSAFYGGDEDSYCWQPRQKKGSLIKQLTYCTWLPLPAPATAEARKPFNCPKCHGSGYDDGELELAHVRRTLGRACPVCNGKGDAPAIAERGGEVSVICPTCEGKGEICGGVIGCDPCLDCNGTGKIELPNLKVVTNPTPLASAEVTEGDRALLDKIMFAVDARCSRKVIIDLLRDLATYRTTSVAAAVEETEKDFNRKLDNCWISIDDAGKRIEELKTALAAKQVECEAEHKLARQRLNRECDYLQETDKFQKAALDLCYQIEKSGASVELTKCSVMASALHDSIKEFAECAPDEVRNLPLLLPSHVAVEREELEKIESVLNLCKSHFYNELMEDRSQELYAAIDEVIPGPAHKLLALRPATPANEGKEDGR